MSFPLENARLCMDCDTVFDGPLCPSCTSESFFPLSRWIRPALEELQPRPERPTRQKVAQAANQTATKTARNASLVLAGSGLAYALWKAFMSTGGKEIPAAEKPPRKSRKEKRGDTGDKLRNQ